MKKLIQKLQSLAHVTFIEVKQADTIFGEKSTAVDYSVTSDTSSSLDSSGLGDYSVTQD